MERPALFSRFQLPDDDTALLAAQDEVMAVRRMLEEQEARGQAGVNWAPVIPNPPGDDWQGFDYRHSPASAPPGGYTPPRPGPQPEDSLLRRQFWGVLNSVGRHGEGLLSGVGDLAHYLTGNWGIFEDTILDDVVNGRLVWGDLADPDGLAVQWESASERRIRDARNPEAIAGIGAAIHGLADIMGDIGSESYRPKYPDFEQAIEEAGEGRFGYLGGWMLENLPQVGSDLFFAAFTPKLYGLALTGTFAQERAENDMRENPTREDYAVGAVTAATVLMLERIAALGWRGAFGQEALDRIARIGGETVAARAVRGAARGSLFEGTAEGMEEVMLSAGTEKGVQSRDVYLATLAGALLGGPLGGGIDIARGPRGSRPAIERVASDLEAGLGATQPPTPSSPPPAPEAPPAPDQQAELGEVSAPPDLPVPEALGTLPTPDAAPDAALPTAPESGPQEGVLPTEPQQLQAEATQLFGLHEQQTRLDDGSLEDAILTLADLARSQGVEFSLDGRDGTANFTAMVEDFLTAVQHGGEPSNIMGRLYRELTAGQPAAEQGAIPSDPVADMPIGRTQAARPRMPAADTAAGQLLRAMQSPDSRPQGLDVSGVQVRDRFVGMFEALSDYARASIVRAERVFEGQRGKIDETQRQNALNRAQQNLFDIAYRLQRSASEIRRFVANESNALGAAEVAGLLQEVGRDLEYLQNVGFTRAELGQMLGAGDTSAVLDEVTRVTEEARRVTEETVGADRGALPEFPAATLEDSRTRMGPAFEMEQARRNVQDWRGDVRMGSTTARMGQYDPETGRRDFDVATRDEDFRADVREEDAQQRRRLFGEMSEMGEAAPAAIDVQMRQAEAKARKRGILSDTVADADPTKVAVSRTRKKRAEAKRTEHKGPQFSFAVLAEYARGADTTAAELQGRMRRDKLTDTEKTALRAVEKRIAAERAKKEAAKPARQRKPADTGPRTFQPQSRTGERVKAKAFLDRIMKLSEDAGERVGRMRTMALAARNMAENIIEAASREYYYAPRYVHDGTGTPAKRSDLNLLRNVRPKIDPSQGFNPPRRFAPRVLPDGTAYFLWNQVETGPAARLMEVGTQQGRAILEYERAPQFPQVSTTHYDQLVGFVAKELDAPNPVALADLLLADAEKFIRRSTSGTRGYKGARRTSPTAAVVDATPTLERPQELDPAETPLEDPGEVDIGPAGELQEDAGTDPGRLHPEGMTDEQFIEFLRRNGLTVEPSEVGNVREQISRFQSLQLAIAGQQQLISDLQAYLADIDVHLQALDVVDATPDHQGHLDMFLDGAPTVAQVLASADTPGGHTVAMAMEDGSTFWHDQSLSDEGTVVLLNQEGVLRDNLENMFTRSIEAKLEIAKMNLEGFRKDLKNAEDELRKTGLTPRPAKTRRAGREEGRADTGAEPTGLVERPIDVNATRREVIQGPRRIIDFFEGITGREPRNDVVDLSRYGPESGRDFVLNAHQREGVAAAMHNYIARQTAIQERGRKSVYRAGMLIMDGTGVGKSAQAAVIAHEIAQIEQQRKKPRPVGILVPPGPGSSARDTEYARNIISDAAQLGIQLDPSQVQFYTYNELQDLGRFRNQQFAALLFDEAHNIKNSGASAIWAPNAERLDADFRVFLTATPTDMAGQELYYLAYMLSDVDPTNNLRAARAHLMDVLGIRLDSTGEIEGFDYANQEAVDRYASRLSPLVDKAGQQWQAMSRSLDPATRNAVEILPDAQVDQGALDLIKDNPEHAARLSEWAKLPGLVDSTVREIEGGNQVIVIFSTVNDSRKARGRLGRYHKSPATAFADQLRVRLIDQGVTAPIVEYYGTKGGSATIAMFQSGEARVLVGSDAKLATGLNLDDNPAGTRAKYELDYTPQSRPRVTLIAGAQRVAETFIQLAGRTDRMNTQTVPTSKFITMENNSYDSVLRNSLRGKIRIQESVSGKARALADGTYVEDTPSFVRLTDDSGNLLFHERGERASPVPGDQRVMDTARRTGDAQQTLRSIIETTPDADIRHVAEKMLALPDAPRVFVLPDQVVSELEADGGLDWWGLYEPDTGHVYVHPGAEAASEIILHEMAHHHTYQAITQNPALRADIRRVMEAVPEAVYELVPQASHNELEFVAYAFSNQQFMAALRNTPYQRQTLWDRFKEVVRRILLRRGAAIRPSAFDKIMDLNLLDPAAIHARTEAAAIGDQSRHSPLFRLKPEVARPMGVTGKQTIFNRLASMVNTGRVSEAMSKVSNAALMSMTYEQIVRWYSPWAEHNTMDGPRNPLRDLLNHQMGRYAMSQRYANEYRDKVILPTRDYMTGKGKRMVKISMAPGQPAVTMSESEVVANMMTMSGYGQLHFGKDINDRANSVVASMLKNNTAGEQTAIWKHFKPRFDRLSPEARKLYNDLAQYFADNYDLRAAVAGGQWLDINAPLEGDQSWTMRKPEEIRAKVREMKKLSKEQLIDLKISADSLREVTSILQPGRVPGAYFPMRRFGKYVVTAEGRIPFTNEAERDALLDRYLGARVDEKAGEIVYRSVNRFETENDAATFSAEMQEANTEFDVSGVMLAEDYITRTDPTSGVQSHLLAQVRDKLEKDTGDVQTRETNQIALRSLATAMLELAPQHGFGASLLQRGRVLGASTDMVRIFSHFGAGQSHYISSMRYSKKIAQSKRELMSFIKQEGRAFAHAKDAKNTRAARARALGRVLREFNKREQQMVNPFDMTDFWQGISDIGFGYYLVGASYNLVNMTQVPMYAVPFLSGRHGAARSSRAVARAYKAVGGAPAMKLLSTAGSLTELRQLLSSRQNRPDFDKKNYRIIDDVLASVKDPNHDRLVRELAEKGAIEATLAMDFARTSERAHVDAQGRPRPQKATEYLAEWMKMAPHIVEVMNRSVTAVAAFDLEYSRLLKSGQSKEAAYRGAADYAHRAIIESQFLYQPWNRARIMQGQQLKTIMMFKQHVQNTMFNMIHNFVLGSRPLTAWLRGDKLTPVEALEAKEARKALTYFLGFMLMVNGAVGGVPEPLKWLTSLVYWLTSDNDEPFVWELQVQQAMADFAGPEMGQILSKGLPSLIGMDVGQRIGINSMLLLGDMGGDSRDSMTANIMRTIGGPMFALGERFGYDVPNHIAAGRYMRAAEAATPKAIRDILRAIRIQNEGFQDLRGNVYATSEGLSWWDYTQMYLGFTPRQMTQIFDQRAVLGIDSAMMSQRSEFYNRYQRSTSNAERTRILRDIRAWNQRNPYYQISMRQLRDSMATRRRNEAETRNAVFVPRTRRPYIDQQLRFVPPQ